MDKTPVEQFVHKTVTFPFQGQTLSFKLSQSLFSSAAVDDGSRLLLKAIAAQIDLTGVEQILDVGCGVGILGLCLQKAQPGSRVTAQDRDALALRFAQENARLNDIDRFSIQPGLGLQNVDGRQFDLIVSNLPGKAGVPVLQALVSQMPAYLSPNGHGALVVVNPLAEAVNNTLGRINSRIVYQDSTKMHTIILFAGGDPSPAPADPLAVYRRANNTFKVEKRGCTLAVVYNIPDFDIVGYPTRLALKMLGNYNLDGRLLFWNPGQGHLPLAAALGRGQIEQYTLAGRDELSLQISAYNLQQQGIRPTQICRHHLPALPDLPGTYDHIILFPDNDPGVPWSRLLPATCARLLADNGRLLLIAKTGFTGRLLAENKQLTPLLNKKYHGFKAVYLEKK